MSEPTDPAIQPPKRILFLFSDTGGGHRAAAEAVIAALNEKYGAQVRCELIDVFREYSPAPFKYAPEIYPLWIKRGKLMWTLGYHMSDRRGQPRMMTFLVRSIWRKFKEGLDRLFQEHPSDLIVCVHPLFNTLTMATLRRLPQRPPYVTIVTDLVSTHAFWFNRNVERILVPTEPAFERGLRFGISPDKMRITGLPVHPKFASSLTSKTEARAKLGWDEKLTTILLVGGGDGMGPLYHIARRINALNLPNQLEYQLAIVAGRNEQLRDNLNKVAWKQPTHVYGFVTNMPELMAGADILVTKAGPGTISEACMAGLPMIISDHIPGQEYGNVQYVREHGAGVYARGPRKVAQVVQKWLSESPEQLRVRATNAHKLARPNAVWDIVEELWHYANMPPIMQPQKPKRGSAAQRRFQRTGSRKGEQ